MIVFRNMTAVPDSAFRFACEEMLFRFPWLPDDMRVAYVEAAAEIPVDVDWAIRRIPRREGNTSDDTLWTSEADKVVLNTDLVGRVIACLTCAHESDAPRDQHGRFSLRNAKDASIFDEPFLDSAVRGCATRLRMLLAKAEWRASAPWPGEPPIQLSHDVDSLFGKSLVRYGYWLARGVLHGRVRAEVKRIGQWMDASEDEHFSLRRFAEAERQHQCQSTFFMMALPTTISREGRRYRCQDPRIVEAVTSLATEGWEFGLHASYGSYLSESAVKRECDRFQRAFGFYPRHVRNHYLRFDPTRSWELYERLGFVADCTLGLAERTGFRAGTCYPFRPYSGGKRLKIREYPLSIMDLGVQRQLGGPANAADIVSLVWEVLKKSSAVNGVGSVLWHTDRFGELDFPEYAKAYQELLRLCETSGRRGMTHQQLAALLDPHEAAIREQIKWA